MAEVDQVIHAVFRYIYMLQENGPDERIWNEIKTIEELSFRYIEDVPPVENVETLSENMHKFQPADYITGETLLFEFNPKVKHILIANNFCGVSFVSLLSFSGYNKLHKCIEGGQCQHNDIIEGI